MYSPNLCRMEPQSRLLNASSLSRYIREMVAELPWLKRLTFNMLSIVLACFWRKTLNNARTKRRERVSPLLCPVCQRDSSLCSIQSGSSKANPCQAVYGLRRNPRAHVSNLWLQQKINRAKRARYCSSSATIGAYPLSRNTFNETGKESLCPRCRYVWVPPVWPYSELVPYLIDTSF